MPKCKRGRYGHGGVPNCMSTGKVERRITRSAHKGYGNGGSSFNGHRGQVKCHDCGYQWFSTLSRSGREKCWGDEPCTHADSFATEEK